MATGCCTALAAASVAHIICEICERSPILLSIVLWRPIFIIALYVIVLWREFNCVKKPQSKVNKSVNHWGNLRAKGGVVPLSVYT